MIKFQFLQSIYKRRFSGSFWLSFVLSVLLFSSSNLVYALIQNKADVESKPKTVLPLKDNLTYWTFEQGIPQGKELIVKGRVPLDQRSTQAAKQARVLVRVDHTTSHHYYSRFNHEQLLAKGNFTIRIDMDQLKTGHRAPFTSAESRRIYLKTLSGEVQFKEAYLIDKPSASTRITGWDFSLDKPTGAWGFHSLTPTSTWESIGGHANNKPEFGVINGTLRGRDRPYHDELIRDGIEGIKQVNLPLDNGIWQVTLWTQDIGEWEYLPHPLKRTLRLNKQVVLQESLTAEQWSDQNYLIPLKVSSKALNSYKNYRTSNLHYEFWHQIGSTRGTPINAVVEVRNGILQIDLLSDHPSGQFLSAVIAIPWDNHAESILSDFNDQRAQNFFERWPIIAQPDLLKINELSNLVEWGEQPQPFAKDELVTLRIRFSEDLGRLQSSMMPLKNMTWFQMTPMLNRVGGQENALTLKPYLSSFSPNNQTAKKGDTWIVTGSYDPAYKDKSNHKSLKNHALENKRFNQKSTVAKIASLSFEHGQLESHFQTLKRGSGQDVTLAKTSTPIGIYLDFAPHLSWFSQQDANRQADRDYQFIRKFGLTGVAPALPTPTKHIGSIQSFKRATQAPLLAGLMPPFPAYTPLKRMLNQSQEDQIKTLKSLQSLNSLLLWSLADEPGLFPELDHNLSNMNTVMDRFLPEMSRFAQLNHARHDALASQYTDVAINQGYQITQERLNALKKNKVNYYLYNLPNLRFSAGAYLWFTQAQGFWQWHGRMPTAHPFDPTDGREDDVQFFLPTKNTILSSNGSTENPVIIRADLLNLRTGVNDYRWLEWLSQNAKHHIDFAILEQKLQSLLSKKELKPFENNRLNNINLDIKQLAQRLQ